MAKIRIHFQPQFLVENYRLGAEKAEARGSVTKTVTLTSNEVFAGPKLQFADENGGWG